MPEWICGMVIVQECDARVDVWYGDCAGVRCQSGCVVLCGDCGMKACCPCSSYGNCCRCQ
jgi:hypothetical protein